MVEDRADTQDSSNSELPEEERDNLEAIGSWNGSSPVEGGLSVEFNGRTNRRHPSQIVARSIGSGERMTQVPGD
jgi:hypothetical protein